MSLKHHRQTDCLIALARALDEVVPLLAVMSPPVAPLVAPLEAQADAAPNPAMAPPSATPF